MSRHLNNHKSYAMLTRFIYDIGSSFDTRKCLHFLYLWGPLRPHSIPPMSLSTQNIKSINFGAKLIWSFSLDNVQFIAKCPLMIFLLFWTFGNKKNWLWHIIWLQLYRYIIWKQWINISNDYNVIIYQLITIGYKMPYDYYCIIWLLLYQYIIYYHCINL